MKTIQEINEKIADCKQSIGNIEKEIELLNERKIRCIEFKEALVRLAYDARELQERWEDIENETDLRVIGTNYPITLPPFEDLVSSLDRWKEVLVDK